MTPKGTLTIDKGIEILEGALAIGRQAEPLGSEVVHARLEAVRGKARATGPKPDRALLNKVKSWFTADLERAD